MDTPFWKNPCNIDENDIQIDLKNLEELKLPEAKLAFNILNQANAALTSAYQIKNSLISTIFRMEYDKAEEMFKINRLCFLPTKNDIPKDPGECTPLDILAEVKFITALPVLFTSFQRIAAGMEIMLKNENYKRFSDMEEHIRNVLCDIYTAMKETKLEIPTDVSRDVVPLYYRTMKEQRECEIRDYVIFRDYINALEYTVDIFNRLLQSYPTISFFQTDGSTEV